MNDQTNGGTKKQQIIGPSEALSELSLARDIMKMEADQAMEFAMAHPRKLDIVRRKIEEVVLYDEASAKACVYALPRAGKAIVGPSVGFTDALFSAFGNCRRDDRLVAIDRKEKIVICQGIFIDLESNNATITSATRRIVDSKGRLYNDDMIGVTIMACKAIAGRNAVLKGTQRPIWFPIFQRALITVRGTEATLPERRDELIKLFASHGVEPKRIAAALGVKERAEITLDHMVVLQGMWEQLKNGDITAEEMFDPRRMTSGGFETDENPLGDERASAGPPAEGSASGGGTVPANATGEPAPQASEKAADAPEPKTPVEAAAAVKKQPAAAPAQAKAAPTEKEPTEPSEYAIYATAWMNAATSGPDIETRWRRERQLRNNIGIPVDDLGPLQDLKKKRIAELGA